LVGTDSRQYRDLEKRLFPYAGKKPTDLTSQEIDNISKLKLDISISFIVGWDNDEAFGQPYTPEYAVELFSKPEAKFILDQVEAFVSERGNFLQSSKK